MAGEDSPNTLFLYVCVSKSNPKFDWSQIGDALGLKPSAASMRWKRLKARLDNAGVPSQISASSKIDESTIFLSQCIKSSALKIDFAAVGNATGLKPGAAAMRYRRLLNKINKQEGEGSGEEGASTAAAAATATNAAAAATPATTTTPAKTAKAPGGLSRGRKRKFETPYPKPDSEEGYLAGDKVAATAKKMKTEAKQKQEDKEQK